MLRTLRKTADRRVPYGNRYARINLCLDTAAGPLSTSEIAHITAMPYSSAYAALRHMAQDANIISRDGKWARNTEVK